MNDSPPLQYSSIDFDSIIGADVAINRNLSFDSIIATNTISARHDLHSEVKKFTFVTCEWEYYRENKW